MENDINTGKNVISVGAGRNQVPLIKRLYEKDYKVIAFDKDLNAPGKELCYRFKNISTWDYEQAINWIESLNIKIEGVLCFSYGKAILTQQKLISYYKLRCGLDDELLMVMEDKTKLRKLLKENKLSNIMELNLAETPICDLRDRRYIVKNKMGGSSKDIYLTKGNDLIDLIKKNVINNDFLVQEYIRGSDVRVICLIEKKESKFISLLRRESLDQTFFTARLFPLVLDQKEQYDYLNIIRKLACLFGISCGLMRLDLVENENGKEILEIDFGIGGDYFETYISPLCYRYNYIDNYINLMLGLPVQDEYEVEDNLCFDYIYNLNREKVVIVNYDIIRNTCQDNFSRFELIKIKPEGVRVHYPKSNMDALFAIIHNRKEMSNYEMNLLFNKALFNEVPL